MLVFERDVGSGLFLYSCFFFVFSRAGGKEAGAMRAELVASAAAAAAAGLNHVLICFLLLRPCGCVLTLASCSWLNPRRTAALLVWQRWRTKARRSPKWLRTADMASFVDRYDTWLLDCDGVVWLGEQAVEGVPEFLAELRRRGKRVFFVSNNASKHRDTYLSKFKKLGIQATVDDVITSALGAAQYVVQRYGRGAKVFACGTSGLVQELSEAGATVVEPSYVSNTQSNATGPALIAKGELDMDIRAVVAGADWTLSHRKLSYATLCLTCIPGCELIATNRDRLVPQSDGYKYPGAAATVGALEAVSDRRADVTIGKPGPKLLEILFSSNASLHKRRAIMVGDRLDTDIEFGNLGQVDTLLVLTGVTDRRAAEAAVGAQQPCFVVGSLANLHG